MLRIHNIGGLPADAIDAFCRFMDEAPDKARVANTNKRQYIYPLEHGGVALVAKVYHHRKWVHRLAAFLNQANADRYADIGLHLAGHGLAVPEPLLVVRRGSGLLPDRTLLVMKRVPGEMIVSRLDEIERDPARIAFLAPGIAAIIAGLREARVIHRDLSTKNILVTADNRLSLIDFDFARRHHGTAASFQRKHRRDIRCFLDTCGRSPALTTAVAARLAADGFDLGKAEGAFDTAP